MAAQIGWIDFSEKDKKKALDVIHLLNGQGAVDELGIGTIRDAFANYFFPGTSTIQTRAKYFFIIPYVMREACSNPKLTTVAQIAQAVNDRERECGKKMGNNDGVIGREVLPKGWVARRPSNIYWTGLKKLGIFTYPDYSMTEYYREELHRRASKSMDSGNRSGEENEQDDDTATASGLRSFWNLPPEYSLNPDWLDDLTIDLEPWEAKWLRKRISTSNNLRGSLFKFIVDNNINVEEYSHSQDPFKALTLAIQDRVDKEMQEMFNLANRFNSLVYLCRILYNRILNNTEAENKWESEQRRLDDIKQLDIKYLLDQVNISNYKLQKFLTEMQRHLISRDIEAAKARIINREIELKGVNRAKLCRNMNPKKEQPWIGGHLLDFRFSSAARLIKDIYNAESNVQS